jgi:PIN domain nuclease of toxin-antitoxin system
MRVLLDTHTLLWALVSPSKLGKRAREIIEDPDNVRVVSAASAWEIATKHRLGKLDEAEDVVRGYSDHLATLMAAELPVSARHALAAGSWETPHRDPFDRMLAAQSVIEGLAILTNDRAMRQFGVKTIW